MTGIAKRSRKYNDLGSEIIQITEYSSIFQKFYFQRDLFLCLQFYSLINSFRDTERDVRMGREKVPVNYVIVLRQVLLCLGTIL